MGLQHQHLAKSLVTRSRQAPDLQRGRMKKKNERGMTLIELMIAMLVVAIGFGGTTILLTGTIASDNKNSTDTAATLLAQMVMEQISSQAINSTQTIAVTDCAGTSWTIATA